MTSLSKSKSLNSIDISDTLISSEGVQSLRNFKLNYLNCSNTSIDDDILPTLTKFTELKTLILQNTLITDKCVGGITSLDKLSSLDLKGCSITDNSIIHLSNMNKLKYLSIFLTSITSDGVKELKRNLPFCHIDN